MPSNATALALDDQRNYYDPDLGAWTTSNNHDLYLDPTTKQIAFATTTQDVLSQRIRCRLLTVQGELYQTPDIGVPYFDQVLVKGPDLNTLKHLFTTIIAGVPGVKTVDSLHLSVDAKTRTLSVNFAVTADDETAVTGAI